MFRVLRQAIASALRTLYFAREHRSGRARTAHLRARRITAAKWPAPSGRSTRRASPKTRPPCAREYSALPNYLAQSRLVFEDEHKLLRYALGQFREGLLFVYFSSIDQNSHMLWGKHEPELLETYRAVDASSVKSWRTRAAPTSIVMSDHGFTTLRSGFQPEHLASEEWLPGDRGRSRRRRSAVRACRLVANAGLRARPERSLSESCRPGEAGNCAAGAESQDSLRKIGEELLAFRDPAGGHRLSKRLSRRRSRTLRPT